MSTHEDRRLILQAELDALKTPKERNRLGQFATPTLLAADVLKCAAQLMSAEDKVRFLDPAIGTGSFYSALLSHFPKSRLESATGIEIDPHYGEPGQDLWRDHLLEIELGDFTELKAPSEKKRFNLLICNPPYVRHHHVIGAKKKQLKAKAFSASGIRIEGLAGLYCYFMAIAHDWMADGGLAGWLIPSEFMDVNYGKALKQYLLEKVELVRIHRFDPDDVQFGDALVSSAVVWFRKKVPTANSKVIFSYGGALAVPKISKTIARTDLTISAKWTGLASWGTRALHEGPKLSDFFKIKRGLATGDNKFFLMTREQIGERKLPFEFFKPILPGPRYLPSDIVEAGCDGAPKLERQLFMLDCRLPEMEIKRNYPTLWAYLKGGQPSVSETYLCRHRSPWYVQENRPPPPFLCTYMGRGLEKRERPFRFILNKSKATAANVYLLLYPNPDLAGALVDNPELATHIWEYLNAIPSETLLGEGRVYGGGLYKLEPKELANVPAQTISDLLAAGGQGMQRQRGLFEETAA